ncbi:MAG: Cobalamin biosynthesis protein CobD [Candidatus Nitrospira kreftii]|uniref:Cobalamin biosynthesis protein CobD n=1 Tax=Candidatus Nitrospira kreftii TaxID=2652173 RepID=A0A7S8FDU8_9BACT|nr:MAG: Cobalamin biosynthesis protein CobD [Candidatus Nitrospira kreftii]
MMGGELLAAAGLDAVAGDPRWFPHPVRGIGIIIRWCDDNIRKVSRHPAVLRAAGIVLALGLPLLVFVLSYEVMVMADEIVWWLGSLVSIGLAWTTLAARDLWSHVQAVSEPLGRGNLSEARRAVGMIVGRDTDRLSQEDVIRATIETTAESISDGIIAPLFYLALGGAPLALAYKAVNTLDSMIGHKDERYVDFGWASARLDDFANWAPARLSAVLIVVVGALVMGESARIRMGWGVLRRDGNRHPSPNSGRPEAAMAGFLGIRLGGSNVYHGIPNDRPLIGLGGRQPILKDIEIASRIIIGVSLLGLLLTMGVMWLV